MPEQYSLEQFLTHALDGEPCVAVRLETPTPLLPPPGVEFRTVDGVDTRTLNALFDAFAKVWDFPPWFGRNYAAFDDFMRDLDNTTNKALEKPHARAYLNEVTHSHLLLVEEPEVFSWFANAMSFYRDYYRDELRPPAAFGLLLSAPPDKLLEVRERWLSVGVEVAELSI
ncbi:barstar family protein [Mycobacterium sp. pR1184]|uniref:barstar family protein n=1 Tax=Mycobacterium sp. pR1184 TaxID=3238981 RepID=UPI00351B26DA